MLLAASITMASTDAAADLILLDIVSNGCGEFDADEGGGDGICAAILLTLGKFNVNGGKVFVGFIQAARSRLAPIGSEFDEFGVYMAMASLLMLLPVPLARWSLMLAVTASVDDDLLMSSSLRCSCNWRT